MFVIASSSGNSNKNVLQWSFLTKWNQLDFDEKLDKYQEYLSHALHLFIVKNDLNFFKLYYDIIDHTFLNNTNELLPYIDSYHQFNKLNLFEQIAILDYFNK